MAGTTEGHEMPPEVGKIDVPIPPEGLVYDYMFEVTSSPLQLTINHLFTVYIHFVFTAKGAWQVDPMVGHHSRQGD